MLFHVSTAMRVIAMKLELQALQIDMFCCPWKRLFLVEL